jgi:hypothetical protein
MNTENTKYLTVTETAKLVKKRLKEKFPGSKFSVRSDKYSGGASLNIWWLDGPTTDMVNAVVGVFRGAGFDGMIDMAFYVNHWMLPDGTVTIASSPGTESSMGVYSEINNEKPHPDAVKVSFGSDYISMERSLSPEFVKDTLREVWETYGEVKRVFPELPDDIVLVSGYDGSGYINPNVGNEYLSDNDCHLNNLVHRIGWKKVGETRNYIEKKT